VSEQEISLGAPNLAPARILNEYAYCPRLAYLEWVQKEWADNVETLEGKHAHRRVDRDEAARRELPTRSIELASENLGLIAVIDLLERSGGTVRPVEYKRGRKPPVADGAWEPERVQLCAQGLLLREHGLPCHEGILYFTQSKEKVRIRFTRELEARTRELLAEMRERFASGTIPPPLDDSPKCPRCSLVRICLPEETRFLAAGGPVRPLAASDPASFPLVVQDPRLKVRLDGERLVLREGDRLMQSARLGETSQLVLVGGAGCSEPVVHECCRRGIPIVHMSGTGWLLGITHGLLHKNVELRREQFATAADRDRSLAVARALVAAKIHNQRVLLRRNGAPEETTLLRLKELVRDAELATDDEQLLGLEGTAARHYFGAFASMLGSAGTLLLPEGRNRRPPTDPVNAALSFVYGLLTKDWVTTLAAVGLDPLMGFYHRPRYGKPALALDLMEPFRPVIADSTVVGAFNNGELGADDFQDRMGGVQLLPHARRRLIAAYERRLAQTLTHPTFGYACSYRRLFELEARLLGRFLLGEVPAYTAIRVR
jgi:CRISPR-associated protein Cas1